MNTTANPRTVSIVLPILIALTLATLAPTSLAGPGPRRDLAQCWARQQEDCPYPCPDYPAQVLETLRLRAQEWYANHPACLPPCLDDDDTCRNWNGNGWWLPYAEPITDGDLDDLDDVSPAGQMQDLLQFVRQAIQDGQLVGVGRGRSAPRRLRAFTNKLEAAARKIDDGEFEDAAKFLQNVLRFADGRRRPPDFVAGAALPELVRRIQALIDALRNAVNPQYTLTVTIVGQGSVAVDPALAAYAPGQVVQLTAAAETNWTFVGFSGDLETMDNPATIAIDADSAITATFEPVDVEALIELWYGDNQPFGHLGVPQPWVNILGAILDPDAVASLTCSLNGGPEMPLSIGPDENVRLALPGDFNAEIPFADLNPGLNDLTLTATTTAAEQVARSVSIDYAQGNTWPLPYSVDWTTVANLQDAVQVIDGFWAATPQGAQVVEPGYDRNIVLGDLAWQDYEITVDVRIDSIDIYSGQPGGRPAVGILLRWLGHTSWNPDDQPRIGWYPCGALGWFKWGTIVDSGSYQIVGSGGLIDVVDTSGLIPEIGTQYTWKMRVETLADLSSLYSLKVWPTADAEPAEWLLTYQNDPDDPSAGSIMLLAHHADVTFGNLSVVPLEPAPE